MLKILLSILFVLIFVTIFAVFIFGNLYCKDEYWDRFVFKDE